MALEQVGRYDIKGYLGRGGMSTVYLAHDPLFERNVAIKLLPHDLLRQPTFRERFEREAKIIAALDHPAIVPVYDIGDEEGQPYIVMRHMPGDSLAERLEQGELALADIVHIMVRLALALYEVHTHGIVHRDLKPSNILFDQWDEPYISDFGTAKLAQEHAGLTEPGASVGTPAYMSPEQIRGSPDIDGRSDIYALGVILFEMLTRRHPFNTDTPIGAALKHVTAPVPLIQDFRLGIPPAFQAVVDCAMAKDREDRYQTAALFAQELASSLDGSPSSIVGKVNPRTTGKFTASADKEEVSHNAGVTNRLFSRFRLAWIGSAVFLGAFIIIGGSWVTSAETIPKPNPSAAIVSTRDTPTVTPARVLAAMREPSATAEPMASTTPSRSSTLRPTITSKPLPSLTESPAEDVDYAKVVIPSSVFAQPSVDSQELEILRPGKLVTVLGRSPIGQWLFVKTEAEVEGYLYGDRVEWPGEFEALPTVSPPTTVAGDCVEGECPLLYLDVYPLPGSRCTPDKIYRSVYLRGQGGNHVYTYYWNGVKLGGPIRNDGFTIEVDNSTGTFITAMAKVRSGDGQVAEVEAYVSDFGCE